MKIMRLVWYWTLFVCLLFTNSYAGEPAHRSSLDDLTAPYQDTAAFNRVAKDSLPASFGALQPFDRLALETGTGGLSAGTTADASLDSLPDEETQSGLILVQSSGHGSKYTSKSGRLIVLNLQGTFREMGRQYGGFLSMEIRKMNREVVRQYALHKLVIPNEPLEDFSKKLFSLYPARFEALARGISEGAGIDLDLLAVNSEFFDYLLKFAAVTSATGSSSPSCSAISTWGAYTTDTSLVMGRDFDFPSWYREFAPYLVVVVFNPTDGSSPTALLTYAGQLGAIQGFNKAGLVLENNDASSYGDMNRHFGKRIPFLAGLPEILFDFDSVGGLNAAMLSFRSHYPLIYNFASPRTAYVYEAATYEVKRRGAEKEGLLVGVNHFVDPSWPTLSTRIPAIIKDSKLRQKNLIALAEKNKGQIDAARMRSIMDVLVQDGGPTPPDENIYRYVAVPELKRWWVKAPGYFGWTRIDLDVLFR